MNKINCYSLIVGVGLLVSTALSGYSLYKIHVGSADKKDKIIGDIGLVGLTTTSIYGLIKNPIFDKVDILGIANELEEILK
jgi:hypothetical protein